MKQFDNLTIFYSQEFPNSNFLGIRFGSPHSWKYTLFTLSETPVKIS